MEQILKETAKKAPIPTAALVTLIWIFSKILDKELSEWVYAVIAFLTFLLSSLVIYIGHSKKDSQSKVQISDQNISGIDTDGGNFTVGSKKSSTDDIKIEKNKIKDVKTGGGDFTIGSSGD